MALSFELDLYFFWTSFGKTQLLVPKHIFLYVPRIFKLVAYHHLHRFQRRSVLHRKIAKCSPPDALLAFAQTVDSVQVVPARKLLSAKITSTYVNK